MVSARRPTPVSAALNGISQKSSSEETPEALILRQRDTAQYISDMILELRNMAKSNRLFQVMVPLEYAYYEAFSFANRVEVPPEEAERMRELTRAAEDIAHPAEDY